MKLGWCCAQGVKQVVDRAGKLSHASHAPVMSVTILYREAPPITELCFSHHALHIKSLWTPASKTLCCCYKTIDINVSNASCTA